MDNLIYWIWLSLACTPDTSTFPKLIEKFCDAKRIYDADIKSISRVIGNSASDRTALADKELEKATEVYEFCKKHSIGIVTYGDDEYPNSLRDIQTPPVLLYYRGSLPDFNIGVYIASVGTRSLSEYGRRSAFKISYDLASAGATVVSGMAVGIDGVSHAGALAAGASTLAVIGSGIDICYPSGHLQLARAIVKCGCVLTEFAPGTPPSRYNFPKRNRIISGLCAATIVVEGSERSGSMITARFAKKQGRAVYALPGNVGQKNSEASNLLIKNGARLVSCAEDIIEHFAESHRGALNPFKLKPRCPVDMMAALREYGVQAVCPGDGIFIPPRSERKAKESEVKILDTHVCEVTSEPPSSFDAKALKLYKKIPTAGECTLESLIDSEFSLRDIMKYLLKLEMGHFIVMLPGEKVARKSK